MKKTPIAQIVEAVHGTLHCGDPSAEITSVSTDTRSLGVGAAFFALKGERFDAHDFLDQAVEKQATAIIVERVPEGFNAGGCAVIIVEDTLTALQALASWYRRTLDVEVIGITGSNGKTSTKDFTRAVLEQKFSVNATKGNLNNHIGLPLTVLNTEEHHQVCVLEMGMNHPGEIAPLCSIAHPRIGIITNIGTAHIEYMGSREAIAEEKGELARALGNDGVLLVSAACDFAEYFRSRTKARTIVVGNGRGLVRAEDLKMDSTGSEFSLIVDEEEPIRVKIPVVGRHMISNALLAAGAGYALGMSKEEIAKGLNSVNLTSGRLRTFDSGGVTVFDDTYNANPESMKAAIETLSEVKVTPSSHRYVVLGQMAELGNHADNAHREVGELAADRGLIVLTVGDQALAISEGAASKGGEASHFNTTESAAKWLQEKCVAGDAVLFKGSRAAAMERVMHEAFPNK
ncbi:UDP-N-acetylmuramoyl-tripeptide--D-alanyl-D-alanine ligase [Rubritalea halochordaticola]|uniref:UDP-N-acetylmuramoyl-tripeptide--D-alanyl-D-alanine ligase n=1 Tax=Rubritalea halochordaticola TaxID=714537 RepID=A0ABP9UVS6_9BACT